MVILLIFAFLGGLVTILSPCILPILPIVLSGSITGGKSRPLGIVTGFILSFTFFTLFLSTIVKATGVSPDLLRHIAVVVILLFGISMIVPKFQIWMEQFFSRLATLAPKNSQGTGFVSGIFVGLSLGLVWAPCVGPILASIISLSFTGTISGTAVLVTLAYSLGTAIPMLAITYGGRQLLTRVPWLLTNSEKIQRGFGVLMIATALAITFNVDRTIQTYILTAFPNYGVGLTKLEDADIVKRELTKLQGENTNTLSDERGKPMNTILDSMLGRAPEFIAGGEWFNSEPLTMESLRGKVVLVDFWTYTCINCIRTLPYIKAWDEKYKDKGLVIVGVHTPEFEFEKNPDNVTKALKDFGITYPVMQDNNYATWNAYANHYWPAKYLVDKNGKIRYTHFGEGDYDTTEKAIQTLLAETGATVDEKINNPTYSVQTKTPELYLGYDRIAALISPEQLIEDKPITFTSPSEISLNQFAFTGTWVLGGERAMPKTGATLTLHFDATQVFLVMRPIAKAGKMKVYLDDVLVSEQTAGEDLINGVVTIDADRLYKLIKLPTQGPHILKLEFLDDNVELYAFTFG